MNINRGSEWRKWDLHFHTPSSYDYKDKNITNQQIIDELVKNNISVVAITDHHVIDLDRFRDLKVLGEAQNLTILPGIEFLSDARGDEPIHFIGIFDSTDKLPYIWKQIESNTDIKRIEGEGKSHNQVYCHLMQTINLIKEHGGIVTIHAGNKTNGIENITHALPHGVAQKEDIAIAIDIFEMGKESDCPGYKDKVIPYLKKKISKHIPMIICTDNHKVSEYIVKQNLWIKADTTFEGLKQIIFEPEHRVKIQKDEPDFKEDKLIIDSVRFVSADNKFTTETIYLNKNLNVIIGGKSSGKSILLYNIAKTLVSDNGFFEKEGILDKYDFKSEDPTFNFEIKTKGGFSQSLYRDENENSIIPEIKYIPQNYLVKLAEPSLNKKGAELNKIVRELINEEPESQKRYEKFISALKANDRHRENIIIEYFTIKDHIDSLKIQLQSKSKKEILETNIRSNTLRLQELNESVGLNQSQIDHFNKLQFEQENNKQNRVKFINDFKKITEFNSEMRDILSSLKNKEILVSNSLEHPELKELFSINSNNIKNSIDELEKFISIFETTKGEDGITRLRNESSLKTLVSEIGRKENEIQEQLKPFLENEEVKKQIETISKSISEDNSSLNAIEQLSKEIRDNQIALENTKQSLFELYRSNYDLYLNLIEDQKSRTSNLESDGLKITGIAKFNFRKFQQNIFSISDGRTASYKQYEICNENRNALSDYNLESILESIKLMFESIIVAETYALNSKADRKHAIEKLLDDYFFDYWEIEFKDDKLGKMSTGKASFVILMLIVGLSRSKAPILIDQPEDNLDNRSITTDLVEYLRNKKLERQIILVTHNPNIVVNADAENIIIANQKGQNDSETSSPYKFDYINGSLENTFAKKDFEKDLLKSMGIREHIAEIVEGGKEAFKKREEKYGF
ncbi:hypothetical protein SF1_19310 [Sphingobacterium faecium NBRC 15299]|uniref:TrlF family AAA-like ATPase n=1 Tax=Sphingobacterium faecium TaxID=34087 RepID=UPI000D3C2A16|nr:hypothetical protein [Sphingobacterium faecium]PTX09423.1 hypothetical protein C8N37_10651 [Sphingobacterium faecium]GEM63949.1 hypothetical protein SF1_19310 [Sphingobacterium faecium NBRC 15299]